jgi:hypothetical protein
MPCTILRGMTTIPAQTLPPLVVSSDPVAARKALSPSIAATQVGIVLFAVLAVVLASMSGSVSGFGVGVLSGAPILISLLFLVYLLTQSATNLGIRTIASPVLTVDTTGLFSSIVQGSITVPWSAIESVSVRKRGKHRIVTFHIDPSTTPETPGVTSTLAPSVFKQLLKRGYQLGSAGINVPMETVLDAAAAFTQGRLVVR